MAVIWDTLLLDRFFQGFRQPQSHPGVARGTAPSQGRLDELPAASIFSQEVSLKFGLISLVGILQVLIVFVPGIFSE